MHELLSSNIGVSEQMQSVALMCRVEGPLLCVIWLLASETEKEFHMLQLQLLYCVNIDDWWLLDVKLGWTERGYPLTK